MIRATIITLSVLGAASTAEGGSRNNMDGVPRSMLTEQVKLLAAKGSHRVQ